VHYRMNHAKLDTHRQFTGSSLVLHLLSLSLL
jgi:hypothetical protein